MSNTENTTPALDAPALQALAAAAHTAVKSGDIGTVYRLELATGEITPFGHCDYEDESNLYVTIWQHEGQPVNVLRGTHFEPSYTTSERTFLDLIESATEDAESYVVFGTLVNTSEPHTNDSSAEALHGLDADGYPGECDCDTLTGWSTVTAPGSTIDEGGA